MPPKRKDAKSAPPPSPAPPQPRLAPAAAPTPARRSPLRLLVLLGRIALCAAALVILWKRLHPIPTAVDLAQDPHRVTYQQIRLDQDKRDAHSYKAYERDAFGFDDYHPISHHGSNMSPVSGPIGYFIIDSLDSLWITGMMDEYNKARNWVEGLSFDLDDKFHTFEITIRVLGGLLSAYHLSGETDTMLLDKAVDLADRLLPAFETPSGLPTSFVNLAKRVGIPDPDNHGLTSLELKYLSELTGNPIYWQKAAKVLLPSPGACPELANPLIPILRTHETAGHARDPRRPVQRRTRPHLPAVCPLHSNFPSSFPDPLLKRNSPDTGQFVPSDIRLGSRGDSYYEYLSKQYLQTNRTEPVYKEMHDEAMGGIKRHLLKMSHGGLWYTNHLVCFLPASLLLGTTLAQSPLPPDESAFDERQTDDWFAGKELLRTCVDTYVRSKTGLAPEVRPSTCHPFSSPLSLAPFPSSPSTRSPTAHPSPNEQIVNFHRTAAAARKEGRDWFINSRARAAPNPPIDARNILRPETVESLFVGWRLTGDPIYREWGWTIFQSFVKHCRLPDGGFASILDVDQVPVKYEDRMETFWISETLKYLYLLFSGPDVLPLDQYVFNTEAHPLPVFTPTVVEAGLE
ncbi:SPOSA6832_04020 [Sporobolomyces salmonicolor]|uniref:alpha-1,2-Mannosidase n=1 Tax=Sporidiobolus salmonicolor TaxID=5005 RepID=A0A0D6ERR0_SPOSA|nr:SPOSA6832_04020 [Sporobolomyces salmonicolor]